jgi:hypothetical protein
MVFIEDSPAERALASLGAGKTIHVLGQPRISLKLLSFRRAHYPEYDRMLDSGLPYEVVILGIYPNSPEVVD